MRTWLLWLLPGVLAGCQMTPTTLPEAEPAPSAECRWPAGPGDDLDRVITALEAEGFVVRHTDASLGLVSADRARTTIYHDNGIERLPRIGGFVRGGSGGHIGTGVVLGFGGGAGPGIDEATRAERVSVVVDGRALRVSRDIRLIDWRGDLRESRSASDADFCRDLRRAIRAVPAGEAS
ncbi:hypothetical protein [Halomonas saccharevitans]|uniref:Uncharacterized protein n=1 Tax=Halomonas saccharevitans TaxID=416872 RepID=A0A1I7BKR8_9GAMM|nr:hypothetical protein [Halomonas saccharevitans]SFT87769.1 hypothetical protein SAMN04487956_12739 [Halomonas saccharevitans]